MKKKDPKVIVWISIPKSLVDKIEQYVGNSTTKEKFIADYVGKLNQWLSSQLGDSVKDSE
jgi:hypothetical protein